VVVDEIDDSFLSDCDQGFVVWDWAPGQSEENDSFAYIEFCLQKFCGWDIGDQFHIRGIPDFDC
jgi:hypothetical protein